MIVNTKAKIYLGSERGCNETDRYRIYNTFSTTDFYNEHKQPFGNLCVLNDVTLAPGESIDLKAEKDSLVFLLPMVGAFCYKDNYKNENTADAGQLLQAEIKGGETVHISNPYQDDLINFIELHIHLGLTNAHEKPGLINFNLDENKDQLVRLSATTPVVSIGKFAGRKETVYNPTNSESKVFIFVIQGAFEVEGRLLHARDGLGLWDVSKEIELEALSNDAIVLLIELEK